MLHKSQPTPFIIITTIFMLLNVREVHAWSLSSLARKCQTCVMSATIVASCQFLHLPTMEELPCYRAYATDMEITTFEHLKDVVYDDDDNNNSNKDNDTNTWIKNNGLTPPTSQRPQIKPPAQLQSPSGSKTSNGKSPIVQGLVYMVDAKDRPDPSDVIVLTVSSVSAPDEIMAGAKYPVYKARIPFNFQFYQANIIKGKEDVYKQQLEREDLLVEASVCPQEAAKLPCKSEERLYEAKGISKMIQVPGMAEPTLFRVPASLPLEKVVQVQQ
jgi:hypothetical protein